MKKGLTISDKKKIVIEKASSGRSVCRGSKSCGLIEKGSFRVRIPSIDNFGSLRPQYYCLEHGLTCLNSKIESLKDVRDKVRELLS